MQDLSPDTIRQAVRERYGNVATAALAGCGDSPSCCGSHTSCCGSTAATAQDIALALGYAPDEVSAVPQGANMGLGCGNPQALAALQAGETVLDLGSGGGFDCFLAARYVGPTGHVIGVDMTPEMLSKARSNAAEVGSRNVEFRLGEIEHLPVADRSVDVILSNCVINLSPHKPQVFAEAFRVLKPGGRLAIADIVATAPLPEAVRNNLALYTGCIAGAALVADVEQMLRQAGFSDIHIRPQNAMKTFLPEGGAGSRIEDYVMSAAITATKT